MAVPWHSNGGIMAYLSQYHRFVTVIRWLCHGTAVTKPSHRHLICDGVAIT
ncbi:MAG: hypothetical protein IIU87_09250 [Prevotella sp.]|nr:hypothetical protein [Prevotella sp.]